MWQTRSPAGARPARVPEGVEPPQGRITPPVAGKDLLPQPRPLGRHLPPLAHQRQTALALCAQKSGVLDHRLAEDREFLDHQSHARGRTEQLPHVFRALDEIGGQPRGLGGIPALGPLDRVVDLHLRPGVLDGLATLGPPFEAGEAIDSRNQYALPV
jgi:hypothetical protein